MIRLGTYNISNGRNGGLESALRGMSQANMDLGIFQETKVTDDIYTRGSAGYSVVATDAQSRHRGGVAVFHRPAPHFVGRPSRNFDPTSSASSWRRGRGCGTSWDVTSTPTTPQR